MNSEYYNDKGKDTNCTDCGNPIDFINERTEFLKSGNILTPETMPFKKRETLIKDWKCPSCGKTGTNYYLVLRNQGELDDIDLQPEYYESELEEE